MVGKWGRGWEYLVIVGETIFLCPSTFTTVMETPIRHFTYENGGNGKKGLIGELLICYSVSRGIVISL